MTLEEVIEKLSEADVADFDSAMETLTEEERRIFWESF